MEDHKGGRDSIAGLPVEEAVETVLDRGDVEDPEAARAVIEPIAEDGVVSQAAAQSVLADVSKMVATPETRVEVAAAALDSARETAEPITDLGAVRARIEEYESRLASVEQRVDALGTSLQRLVEDHGGDGDLYELAVGIDRLTADANDAQRTADELYTEIGAFERWLTSPRARYDELDDDLDALDDALLDLVAAVDDLANAIEGGPDAPETDSEDIARAWTDASLRQRVLGLLLADVRAELAELREWPEDGPGDGAVTGDNAGAARIEQRVDDLEKRLAAIGGRLTDLADAAATDAHERRVTTFEETLEGYESPIRWDEVQSELRAHLAELEDATESPSTHEFSGEQR